MARLSYLLRLIILSITFFLYTYEPCFPQYSKERWRWQTFTVQDGLASNRIQSIWGNEKGNIWVGTRDGWASCYDGRAWQTFTAKDGLAQSTVLSIWGDEEGNVWFGTRAGVSHYNGEEWRNLPESEIGQRIITAVSGDKQGNVWIGIWDKEVVCYNGKTLMLFNEEKDKGFSSGNVQTLWVDNRNRVWVGTEDGLSYYDGEKWQTITKGDGTSISNISAIRDDNSGNIWISSYGDGLICYNEDRKIWESFTAKDNELPSNDILSLWVSNRGDVWVGTEDHGLAHYDGRKWRTYTVEDGLANNTVRAIWGNNKDAIWVGTDGGVTRYEEAKIWHSIILSNPNNEPGVNKSKDTISVQSVYKDRKGNIWIGTSSGLKKILCDIRQPTDIEQLKLYLEGAEREIHSNSPTQAIPSVQVQDLLLGRDVSSICEDRRGNLWVGTSEGMFRIITQKESTYDLRGFKPADRVIVKRFTTNDGLLSSNVKVIREDSKGNLWIGTDAGVNYCVFGNSPERAKSVSPRWISFTKENTNGGLPSNNINAIWCGNSQTRYQKAIDNGNPRYSPKSDVWIATDSGLACYTVAGQEGTPHQPVRGKWKTFTKESTQGGIPSNDIQAVWKDSQGNIWLGVLNPTPQDIHAGAICRYDGRTWRTLRIHSVQVIQSDTHDTIWFGGDDGLLRYDGANWKLFKSKDCGLNSDAIKAIYSDEYGSVIFGTDRGLNIYVPRRPKISIDRVEIPPDRQLDPSSDITLDYDENSIRFYFSVNDMASRAIDIIYKYKLESTSGEGGEWEFMRNISPTEKKNNKRCPELPPGDYVFRIRAGNRNLDYSQERRVNVHVKSGPPWVRIVSVAIDGQICLIKEDKIHETLKVRPQSSFLRNHRQVEIRFVGYDDVTPHELSYRYWIEDQHQRSSNVVDERPNVNSENRFVTAAASLNPGDYRFHVRVKDNDGNRSTEQALIIEIPKPWGIIVLPYIATALTLFILGPSFYSGRRHYKIIKAVKGRFNPYRAGEPIRDDYMFFGRDQLLRNMVLTLHNNSIMLHGERRIGKTTVLYQLKARLEELDDPEYDFIPVFIDLQGISEGDFFSTIIEDIIEECEGRMRDRPKLRFDSNRNRYNFRDFERDVGRVIEALQANSNKNVKLLLLMDEADVMHEYEGQLLQQQLRRIFMQDYTEHLGAVVAGVNIKSEWKRDESPFYNFFNEIKLMPFSREEAERLIKKPVKGIYSYERAAVDMIIGFSGRRPHKIQKFCLLAINHILDQKRRRVRVKDIEYLYRNILSKEFSTEIDEAIGLVNAAIAANRAKVVKNGKVKKL